MKLKMIFYYLTLVIMINIFGQTVLNHKLLLLIPTLSTPPLSTTSVSSPPLPLPKNIPVVIGIAIGAFIVGISLAFGGVFLYKRNKNKKENKKAIPFTGNGIKDTNNEGLEI